MALARQVRLEDKLRAVSIWSMHSPLPIACVERTVVHSTVLTLYFFKCEQKSEGPIQKHSVSTLRLVLCSILTCQ